MANSAVILRLERWLVSVEPLAQINLLRSLTFWFERAVLFSPRRCILALRESRLEYKFLEVSRRVRTRTTRLSPFSLAFSMFDPYFYGWDPRQSSCLKKRRFPPHHNSNPLLTACVARPAAAALQVAGPSAAPAAGRAAAVGCRSPARSRSALVFFPLF